MFYCGGKLSRMMVQNKSYGGGACFTVWGQVKSYGGVSLVLLSDKLNNTMASS